MIEGAGEVAASRDWGGESLSWESEDGHRGICRLDPQGRLVSVEINTFPGDWNAASFSTYLVECDSDEARRRDCSIQSPSTVALVEQKSQADCISGQTWGYEGHTLWVDDDCRGLFEVRPAASFSPYTLLCESDEGRREECDVQPGSRVELAHQESRADCVEGQTWGFEGGILWVDDGCRALFEVSPP